MALHDNALGINAAKNSNYKVAVEHWKKSSVLGYSKSCFNLGLCYELGNGVNKDLTKVSYFHLHWNSYIHKKKNVPFFHCTSLFATTPYLFPFPFYFFLSFLLFFPLSLLLFLSLPYFPFYLLYFFSFFFFPSLSSSLFLQTFSLSLFISVFLSPFLLISFPLSLSHLSSSFPVKEFHVFLYVCVSVLIWMFIYEYMCLLIYMIFDITDSVCMC